MAAITTGQNLELFESVRVRRSMNKLLAIMDNPSNLLHSALVRQQSSFNPAAIKSASGNHSYHPL